MYVSGAVIANITENVIKEYLHKEKVYYNVRDGRDFSYIISDLLDQQVLDEEHFKKFIFNELMYGKRRFIRIYTIRDCRKMRDDSDWLSPLKKDYEVDNLEFNRILDTIVGPGDVSKIAAIHTEYNEKGEMTKINVIFQYYIQLKGEKGFSDSWSYIPIEIDLIERLLIVKSWRRKGIVDENTYKTAGQMDSVVDWLKQKLNIKCEKVDNMYQKLLFRMNTDLLNKMYEAIPAYRDVSNLDKDIEGFEKIVCNKIALENKIENDGKIEIPQKVMDIRDELIKLLQRLTVSDYFYNREFSEVWNLNLPAIVNSVKFTDTENAIAIISSENKTKPVNCGKSFLMLQKAMEESKKIRTICISYRFRNITFKINYDASEPEYIGIGLLSNPKQFNADDLKKIWEMMEQYDTKNLEETKNGSREAIC